MQTVSTIGLDIAKSVFQVHGVDAGGQVVIRRQLKRQSDVEHQAGGAIRQIGDEEVRNGGKLPSIQPERSEQTRNRTSERRVVVDD